jgi:hypothetical protein
MSAESMIRAALNSEPHRVVAPAQGAPTPGLARVALPVAVSVEAPHCSQCAGFGDVCPATHTARYYPASEESGPGAVEVLCEPCARNVWVYTDVQPLPVAAPVVPVGVSLAKVGDAPAPVVPVEYETSEVRMEDHGGGWVTWEPRSRVEEWRRNGLRRGGAGYAVACIWGRVLRGEV